MPYSTLPRLTYRLTGWDSVAVIAGEVVDPHRSLPVMMGCD